jgi:hypothetical protein
MLFYRVPWFAVAQILCTLVFLYASVALVKRQR